MFTPDPKKGKKPKKKPPGIDKKYKAWILMQPCCKPDCQGDCGEVTGAHQTILGGGGTGLKPPDKDMLPLGKFHHDEEHRGSVTFWKQGTKAKTKIFVQELCDKHILKYKEE
jgi:hypothetical protein